MKKVDMSEQAILRRLKLVDQLRELCLSLMKAKKLSDRALREKAPKELVKESPITSGKNF